ncbi:MAG: hypothetical protein HQK54_09615 [Oligoflexales bacterium]|nr:hypothetical protein [Oligoflexales bacterium]
MLTEPLPTSVFVKTRFQEARVYKVIDEWPVDRAAVELVVISYFEDMGILQITPETEIYAIEFIIKLVRNCPEIFKMVEKAKKEEERRRESSRYRNI